MSLSDSASGPNQVRGRSPRAPPSALQELSQRDNRHNRKPYTTHFHRASKMAARRGDGDQLNLFALSRTVSILLLSLSLSFHSQILEVESRELEWGDLGVSLANPKTSYNGNPNNLRILISPQRRMTKSSEFDSSNYSQPTPGEAQFTGLSGGSSYSSPGQSAAYTALSASLASLKSRLNARGVSLSTNRIAGDPSSSSGSYISSEPQRPQTQPNYLSVTNIQDQPMSYSTSSHETHGNENKTIVLAIPAKINFLTDGSSKQSRQQQQQPQLASIQTPSNLERPEYIKHYVSGADGSEQPRDNSPDQEHQLVFVNPSSSSNGNNEQAHLVSSTYGNGQPPYSTVYYHQTGSLPVKYIQPSSQPAEVYHTANVEETGEEHYYENCIDTCNSADPRWRKYTVSKYKYCCSHSSQYDPQFETPSVEKVGESSRQAEDVYYNYLHRKSRGRRARKSPRSLRSHPSRYHAPRPSDEESGSDVVVPPARVERPGYIEYPYMKYYKTRHTHESEAQDSPPARKYAAPKEKRGYVRTREPEVTAGHYEQNTEEEEPARVPSSGYGNSEYSIDSTGYSGDTRGQAADEEDTRAAQEEGRVPSKPSGQMSEVNPDGSEPSEEGEPEQSYRSSPKRRKKYHGKGRSRKSGKEGQAKRNRKSKSIKSEYSLSRVNNTSEYEHAQDEEQYKPDTTTTFDEEPYSKAEEGSGNGSGEESDKYKATLNETAIVHLSKTTMHLKEILSMLEKKTQLKSNESSSPVTTAAPITTTNSYTSLLFNSQLGNPSLSSLDFLSGEQGLKNAYKELGLSPSLALPPGYSKLSSVDSFGPLSGYGSSSGLSLKNAYKDAASLVSPSLAALSPYGAKLTPDPFGALAGFSSSQLGLPSTKYLAYAATNPAAIRRRRVPRNPNRYNQMMLPKSQLHAGSSLLRSPSVTRSPFATSASLYQGLQYPSWYTRSSALAATNSYPFRNLYRTTWFQ